MPPGQTKKQSNCNKRKYHILSRRICFRDRPRITSCITEWFSGRPNNHNVRESLNRPYPSLLASQGAVVNVVSPGYTTDSDTSQLIDRDSIKWVFPVILVSACTRLSREPIQEPNAEKHPAKHDLVGVGLSQLYHGSHRRGWKNAREQSCPVHTQHLNV